MSGIVVLVGADGPPDGRVLDEALSLLVHRGPDGCDRLVVDNVALGHQRFWTTPEEVGERQPVTDADGRFSLALDGRIDNRRELLSDLGQAGRQHECPSDAALLLAAYARWGTDAFGRIVGAWAVALLDRAAKRVVLARDALGDRTLCYWTDGRRLVAASEEVAVLAHPSVGRELDERRLATLFAIRQPDAGQTFFRDVRELPPAHFLTFDAEGLRLTRYWSPRPVRGPLRRSDEEWAAAFRDRLEEAVTCRLRSATPAGVLLSGGLDSVPMTALAARRASAPLLAVSWVFDVFEEADERGYIDEVAGALGLESLQVVCDDARPLHDLESWPFNPSTPEETLYRWLLERTYRAAARRGARTVLSGVAGDDLYVDGGDWLYALLARGRVADGARALAAMAAQAGWLRSLRTVVVRPLVPRRVFERKRERRRRWLTPHAEGLLRGPRDVVVPDVGMRRPGQASAVLGNGNAHALSAETRLASRAGVDLRYPFRDRRLVELALGLPSDQLLLGGRTRPIVRRAFRGLVPDRVLTRTDKTGFEALLHAALVGPEGAHFRDLLGRKGALWRQFVRPDWVEAAPPGKRPDPVEDLVLWHCVCVELWRERMVGYGA